MSAIARTGVAASVIALAVTGCGAAPSHTHRRMTARAPELASARANRPQPEGREVLGIPSVGRFYGRCAPGARRWILRFVDDAGADDFVHYTFGRRASRWIDVRPSATLSWQLRPGAARSREPADPLTNHPATIVPTTMPLDIVISQGTEPHIYRVEVHLALAAAIGDTAHCALVSSQLRAFTYFNGGAPAVA